MSTINSQLRCVALSKQGLTSDQPFGAGVTGTRNAIEHLGYVQIDTLSVVERAHHHTLWNRVKDYDQSHLNDLVRKQVIFEYWYHAASYLPVKDYRFALPNMESVRNNESRYFANVDKRIMKEVLARAKADGPFRLRNLEKAQAVKETWWNWEPTKRAVEKLFMQGDLMISKRDGMEKIYDLTERCLPSDINLSMPSTTEYATYLFDTTLRAHGVITEKQLLHLRKGKALRTAMREVINERLKDQTIQVLDADKQPVIYVETKALEHNKLTNVLVKILSPFDNAVIHRDRLNLLFGYDYRIECYVPKPKRVFGYFCLPILYGDKFVGRIDCKANRAERCFDILSLHLEDQILNEETFLIALNDEIQKFAIFNKCPSFKKIKSLSC